MTNYRMQCYAPVAPSSVTVDSWLSTQLTLQVEGLTGHLDEIWPDVGPTSAWLGGDGENWERGPYYLDGLVPLSYLTRNEMLIAKVERWITAILDSQDDTGFFGPRSNPDWWPRMVALKVLREYYEATGSERIIPFMERYFRYQAALLDTQPLMMWAVARAGENVLSALWLYEKNGDDHLLELSRRLFAQSLDWDSFFATLPFKENLADTTPWSELQPRLEATKALQTETSYHDATKEQRHLFETYHYTHGVNIAMALKYPALKAKLEGNTQPLTVIKQGLHDLAVYHGQIHGLYSCDEHLSGRQPMQGVELCTVVEAMFSLEELFFATGDPYFGDLLERIAYNALPATISPDFTSHQYDQQVNQVICSDAKRNWYNNSDTSNIFGLEPHFGCCLANMHQGWPKLARSLWVRSLSSDLTEIVPLIYTTSQLSTTIDRSLVVLDETTHYPFGSSITFDVTIEGDPVTFTLKLRLPSWCATPTITVNDTQLPCTAGTMETLTRRWRTGDRVVVTLPMEPVMHTDEPTGGVYVTKGPVIYALPIKSTWKTVVDRGRFSDYELHPAEPWAYALTTDNRWCHGTTKNPSWAGTFSPDDVPDSITVAARAVDNWEVSDNSAGAIPKPTAGEAKEEITLIPYGSTDLRITIFPRVTPSSVVDTP